MNVESVRIRRAHARPLAGNLHIPDGAGRGAVLIIHGFKGFKDWGFFPYVAEALAAHGFFALRVNQSGSGIREEGDLFDDPEAFETATLSQALEDAAASAAFLQKSAPRRPLGIFGHSLGGALGIVLASLHPDLRALVTWAAVSRMERFGPDAVAAWERGETWSITNSRTGQVFQMRRNFHDDLKQNRDRFDIRARAAEVMAPWLIVHGEADETVPPSEGEDLYRAADGRARILLISEAGHTLGAVHPFSGETPALRRATDATIDWFAEHLRERASRT